jgi:hypothetical protein
MSPIPEGLNPPGIHAARITMDTTSSQLRQEPASAYQTPPAAWICMPTPDRITAPLLPKARQYAGSVFDAPRTDPTPIKARSAQIIRPRTLWIASDACKFCASYKENVKMSSISAKNMRFGTSAAPVVHGP